MPPEATPSRAERRRAERQRRKAGAPAAPARPASRPWRWLGGVAVVLGLAAGLSAFRGAPGPEEYGFEIVKTYPHDRGAYTQGLLWHRGSLYESTGKYGGSSVREVRLSDGKIVRQNRLSEKYFGEGLAFLGGRFYQLTWKAGKARVYGAETLRFEKEFDYEGEGWGLTTDGKRLIMSDGTAKLRFLDPETFRVLGHLEVKDGETPVQKVNELEWVRGELWANVFQSDRIARIDPKTGAVRGWIDLTGILPKDFVPDYTEVLNGIAYDAKADRIFVTGKFWPWLFEIRVVPKKPAKTRP